MIIMTNTTETNIAMLKMGIKGPINEKYASPTDKCCVCDIPVGDLPNDRLVVNGWALCSFCWMDLDMDEEVYYGQGR
jgi:hypothetical protein